MMGNKGQQDGGKSRNNGMSGAYGEGDAGDVFS